MGSGNWTPFRLIPHDVLFFGDGRPSVMGEDHYLRSLFPPFPSTLYGAIRTRRLLDHDVDLAGAGADAAAWSSLPADLRGEVGEYGKFGTLELRGPWLERRRQALFPAPSDLGLVFREDGKAGSAIQEVVRYRLVEPYSGGRRAWSHGLELLMPYTATNGSWELLSREASPESAAGWYLTIDGIRSWLDGGIPAVDHFVPRSELWLDEVRTGLGLQTDSRVAQNHQLYTYGFVRLRDGVTLGFEVRGTTLEAGGALRLGGDGKTADLVAGDALALPETRGGEGVRTLYFATPSLSEAGAIPPGMNTGTFEGTWDGKTVTLRAAALKDGIPCGGYDLRFRRQKALRRAIPAGSVYFCDGVPDSLHGTNVCGYVGDCLARQGYGLALVGGYR